MRNSLLHIQCGKNLVENKMPDSHWFIEAMERGAKIVTITPEYSPPATKSDYWIPIRPQTDTALFLGVTRLMIDNGWYDVDFVKRFTDFPMLVRTDTLKRLRAAELFPNYQLQLTADGPSFKLQGLTIEQYDRLGDYVVIVAATGQPTAITRDDVGEKMAEKGIGPQLDYRGALTLADGTSVEVLTLWSMYLDHLKDYGLDAVAEMTHAPRDLIERLARDIATTKPTAIHIGEGINHWFHATLANRAQYLPLMLTGNIGIPGAGCYAWAGNYKAALFQGSPWSGPGFKGWVTEDPFEPNLDPNAHGKDVKAHAYAKDEEPAYWNHSERPLIVETPKYGRKVFTGATHMPTPTKVMFFTNVNLINNAKYAYEMIKNVDPNVPLIISVDIEMTATIEYSDFALAANSWVEFQNYEVTASCSNPFLQIWKGSVPPLYDTRDDAVILAQLAAKLGEITGDPRFADYWKFALENRAEVYIQRLLDSSSTTAGYRFEDIMAGKYGEPGAALMLFRTYPRIAFWEQIHDNACVCHRDRVGDLDHGGGRRPDGAEPRGVIVRWQNWLLAAALADWLIGRTLSRAAIFMPKSGIMVTVTQGMMASGQIAFNLTAILTLAAIVWLAVRGLRHTERNLPLSAALAGLVGLSIAGVFVPPGSVTLIVFQVLTLAALTLLVVGSRRAQPGCSAQRAVVPPVLAIASITSFKMVQTVAQLTDAPAPASLALLAFQVGELFVVFSPLAVWWAYGKTGRVRDWVIAGIPAALFTIAYLANPSMTATMATWSVSACICRGRCTPSACGSRQ
ncbi:MAG TPA: molybdopterin-dependent oxidoreductase [Anaerolineae bacterium]|nr:molybdopterin-dependent oxidoreductase [Anaerolineae bacterium]